MSNALRKIIDEDNKARQIVEERLIEICSKSSRLKIEDIYAKVMDITERKLHLNSYKITTFLEWFLEDLENNILVNSDCWDMSVEEIEKEYGENKHWKDEFDKYKNTEHFYFESVDEFKNEMLDWKITHSLDSIYSSLEEEYKIRKEKGLID